MSRSTTPSHEAQVPKDDGPLALAAKAVRILGLVPGTLPHALAALENARDEIRRTADTNIPFGNYIPPSSHCTAEYGGGLMGQIERAKRAMKASRDAMPGVILGYGGKEEMRLAERRSKAANGVLYWQKQVARLQALEPAKPVQPQRSRSWRRKKA